jgi:hypothetical protein
VLLSDVLLLLEILARLKPDYEFTGLPQRREHYGTLPENVKRVSSAANQIFDQFIAVSHRAMFPGKTYWAMNFWPDINTTLTGCQFLDHRTTAWLGECMFSQSKF